MILVGIVVKACIPHSPRFESAKKVYDFHELNIFIDGLRQPRRACKLCNKIKLIISTT